MLPGCYGWVPRVHVGGPAPWEPVGGSLQGVPRSLLPSPGWPGLTCSPPRRGVGAQTEKSERIAMPLFLR